MLTAFVSTSPFPMVVATAVPESAPIRFQTDAQATASRGVSTFVDTTVAMAFAGPLADHVFEPHGAPGGVARLLAPVVGDGPGSGMAAMLLIAGVCGVAVALSGMTSRSVRDIDLLIPDLKINGTDSDREATQAPAR